MWGVEGVTRSTWVNYALDRLNLMVQDDTSNEAYDDDDDPISYEEAMWSLDCKKLQEVMESMKINRVWILVKAPKDIKPIACKWIYKKKIVVDGKVETYKALLVAKGYRQKKDIDYE